jgi:hypothetical protein
VRVAYEALVRRSGALTYHPLGRYRGRDLIGGNDLTTFPTGVGVDYDDYTRVSGGQSVGRAAVLTATNNFTLEWWVRGAGISAQTWEMDNNNGGTNGYSIAILNTSGQVRGIAQGVAFLETTVRGFIHGEWTHWVLQRNANVWAYYMNATLVTVGANSNAPAAPSGATYQAITSSGSVCDFKGLATYTRVLTLDEIREHYLAGRVGGPHILIGGSAATAHQIFAPFIAPTTVVFPQVIDRAVFVVPLSLRWVRN